MAAASFAAMKLSLIDPVTHNRILAVIQKARLPINQMKLPLDEVMAAMHFDKR